MNIKSMIITFLLLTFSGFSYADRIKDLASIAGVRDNQLVGYGLVIGLDGTGDKTKFTGQSLRSMLREMGVKLAPGIDPKSKNVAAVVVHANLTPFAKPGQKMDVTVSSVGDAKSLRGGSLIMTPLKGADGQIYAMAQGNLVVSGFGAEAGDGPPGGGAITAIYTVLTEGDDQQDPIADAARAILDGHIVLSRQLAESGQYPAIDVDASISRVMPQIVSPEHLQQAQSFKQISSTYRQNQDLINIGAYASGSDQKIDEAIALYPSLQAMIKQGMHESVNWQQSLDGLNNTMQKPVPKQNIMSPMTINQPQNAF